jgi:transcriptional regulator with XRE-family HTH domain
VFSARVRKVLTYIAANVRQLRVGFGMTQERLAEAASLDLSFLQRIERAEVNPSIAVLVDLAHALQVGVCVLLQPAEMQEIKRGRPRKVPAASTGKPARKATASASETVPRKVSVKARKAPARKAPAK